MSNLDPLAPSYFSSLTKLHPIVAHVVAKRRFDATGRFGLRATPGGIGTPAFGDGSEVIRLTSNGLIREEAKNVEILEWSEEPSLEMLAKFAGVELDSSFSVGTDTPSMDDASLPISLDSQFMTIVGNWFNFAWIQLDRATLLLAEPSRIQLWPEHFDAGFDGAWGSDRQNQRVNIGASAGDGGVNEPYLYVGPWSSERPGDSEYWTHSFGAVLTYSQLLQFDDSALVANDFFKKGIDLLSGTV